MTLTLPVPAGFGFRSTVYSHGWCSLPPFETGRETVALRRLFELRSGRKVTAEIRQLSPGALSISVPGKPPLSSADRIELKQLVSTCFRLDEDLTGFYEAALPHGRFGWVREAGAGRLLRAPTVFEDAVKMICTTNCSWALTEVMIRNLCLKVGRQNGEPAPAFPSPAAIAGTSEKFLRKEIRAGYRAPYLLELSRQVAAGSLPIEQWRDSTLPTDELFDEVRSVKGIGPYAAGNILKLVGRYDYLGIDSWCRKKFCELHKKGRATTDRVIERFYEPFGRWRGLFFWLDVTRHWYEREFPF